MSQKNTLLFHEYYLQWMTLYKEGAVRQITYAKYQQTHKQLRKLVPDLCLCDLNRQVYQALLNTYAETHEKQTVLDFHHQVKSGILDALEDGLLTVDPTRKIVIKGTITQHHKIKYLNQQQLTKLLAQLNLSDELSIDYFFLLIAKTGLRFSEALGITPDDFDLSRLTLSVNKTWDYKSNKGSFSPTKNTASVRKVPIDWQIAMQFAQLIKDLPKDQPIFITPGKKFYNETANDKLARYCQKADIPEISVHGLRHTHASLLLYAGVSIASVAQRLGHSNMNTTQRTYLHVIQELENADTDKIMRYLTTLM
ncbi:site-specific integrase [Weissella paramesenteroides]|uniref:site-specific integrase n=1 Tax=Weissella paramesenteroides TaxID=1249 RepID=UPI00123A49A1|nr:site-specific integrase [Weissella paramesenteroides]KAA8455589.1 site-specific integrase [Weissella paramesenteroides]KAA8456825.1 site-specific integrase [Weissella paramesenteroides]KAA8458358.1 site-specific integrase [Weissella paramesenteroides]KAA8459650.1 site-specific integrase [Weissella paramesenteroides]KAA8462660.1 site-specific integrase [Weissella paramesenteroides]